MAAEETSWQAIRRIRAELEEEIRELELEEVEAEVLERGRPVLRVLQGGRREEA